MATKLNKDERLRRKEWAKLLYTKENRSQKEIADLVGVSEKTVSEWKQEGKWEDLRKSYTKTKEEQLKDLYAQLDEFNSFIKTKKPEGYRFPDSKESDALKKITASIKDLESDLNVAIIIDVFIAFNNWYRVIDFKKAQEIGDLFDQFIKTKMR